MDGLLIREEDSCSEFESSHSNDESKPIKSKKPNGKKNKLLSRRTKNNPNTQTMTRLSHSKADSKSAINHYTTFRPTAVTSTYTTTSLYANNNNGHIVANTHPTNSMLVKDQQRPNNVNIIGLHPANIAVRNSDDYQKALGIQTNATNSSSSSSSFTSKTQPIHLNEAKKSETLTKELLEEWNRNDDEVDIQIEQIDEFDSKSFLDYQSIPRRSLIYSAQQHPPSHQHQQQQQSGSQPQQKLILALNAGGTSRFSDYSSNSNVVKTQMQREKSSSSMDPWTRRNPSIVAQNVLLKHRAEIEQLAATRNANNNSQTSHASNILATATNSKFPDSKYFKKNNNF